VSSTGTSTGTDGEDVGKATGATRSFFCCTDDWLPLEPEPPSSHTGNTAVNPAVLLQQQQQQEAQLSAPWQQGSYSSSSEEGSSEDEEGVWRGAAAARPGAPRALPSNGHACAAAPPGVCTSQGALLTTCTSTAAGSSHPPSTSSKALHLAPRTYSTPNKKFPQPGLWESNLPMSSTGTPSSSASCMQSVTKSHTQTSSSARQSQRPLHSTDTGTCGEDLDAEEGMEAQPRCRPRGLLYGLPKHAPGSSDAGEEGVAFVQAGVRIRYPAEPISSKPAVVVQQDLVQRQPAMVDTGTGTV